MTDDLLGAGGVILLVITAADIFRSLLVPRASSAVLRVGPALTMALFGHMFI